MMPKSLKSLESLTDIDGTALPIASFRQDRGIWSILARSGRGPVLLLARPSRDCPDSVITIHDPKRPLFVAQVRQCWEHSTWPAKRWPYCTTNVKVVTRKEVWTVAPYTRAELLHERGPTELNEVFVRSLPDNGPVVMVNLLRFKKKSADGDGSGWDAYSRYSKATQPLIKGVDGAILWAGDIEGAAYGDLNVKHWEFVVLVRYPSADCFSQNGHLPGIRAGQRSSRKRRG